MQSNKKIFSGRYGRAVSFLLSCIVVFTLHCKFEISGGGFPESTLLNTLNKLYNSFTPVYYADLVVLFAIWKLFDHVFKKEDRIDIKTAVLSLLMSVLLVTCISFHKFNSSVFILGSGFQFILSVFCMAGFWILIYLTLKSLFFLLEKERVIKKPEGKQSVYVKHFQLFGFLIILAGWLPWILMNYPGTSCPDGNLQLRQFLGDAEWAAGHPPLSSVIMGALFTFGRWIGDANFGFFLYCFFQTCVGAWIFTYSLKKLLDMGIPSGWCTVGILFFAFTPFWGTYAQWFEKDLLYAEIAALQVVFLMEVIRKKSCSIKDGMLLAVSGILASLLRNNGIYAVVPSLAVLAVWLKKKDRKRVLLALLSALAAYTLVVHGLYYGIVDMARPSVGEAMGIPFLQTARYVVYYEDELTEYEREVIDRVLSVDGMNSYNPVDSNPIKGWYRGAELGEYFKVWFQMLWKHPGCYVSAFINKGFGYLAPVSQNIEAWIGLDYYEYDKELGIHHVFGSEPSEALAQIWHLSMTLPLVKYLCSPGLYTWIMLVLALALRKHRKFGGLVLFVPSFMNFLVCLASPLADAMRFAMPMVATVPMMIGWTFYCLHREEADKV